MRRPILLLFIAVLTGLSACSTTPRPITNVDPAADFASYRTFGFIENPSTNTREYESLVTTFLKAAVARENVHGYTFGFIFIRRRQPYEIVTV